MSHKNQTIRTGQTGKMNIIQEAVSTGDKAARTSVFCGHPQFCAYVDALRLS